jgi:predicted TIM-barrel fold metal-dependent hydrolase
VALINLDDIDEGAKELERCAHLGLGGAAISVFPKANPYDNSDYDRFWAVAQDTQMSLSFHVGANRTPGLGRSSGKVQGLTHTNFTTASYWVQVSICKMIFSGVFERFPALKTAIVEHDVGWAPHMISRMDTSYTQRYTRFDEYRYKDSAMLPSDYFRQSVFISFQDDPLGIQHRDIIGVDNLMWGSDYPHPEGTFPKSVEVLSEILKDVPQKDAEKIRAGNAARVYGMNLPGEE